jgi:hypothetical protein
MIRRGLQEVLNDFPFSNFFKQVDGKNWRLHLLILSLRQLWEVTITDRNVHKKGRTISDPAFDL